ncbi:MAG: WbuC family cupin fold metalloprotein [Porphyromonadaceae bacterium]|nr:MAG: WbuC family cupin fold metalloprotein [Porphyromonadaceae bacterium]
MEIDKGLIDGLFEQARGNARLRQNYDLRTSADDNSQRMLNALLPGTDVPVHRHPHSNESVILLCGKVVEVIYEEVDDGLSGMGSESLLASLKGEDVAAGRRLREVKRILLDSAMRAAMAVWCSQGAWHTVEVLAPSVIYEAKDGKIRRRRQRTVVVTTPLAASVQVAAGVR